MANPIPVTMKLRRSSVAQSPFGGCVTIITSPIGAPMWNGDYGLLLSNGVQGRNSGLSCLGHHLITGQHLPRDCDELDGAAGGEGMMRVKPCTPGENGRRVRARGCVPGKRV